MLLEEVSVASSLCLNMFLLDTFSMCKLLNWFLDKAEIVFASSIFTGLK